MNEKGEKEELKAELELAPPLTPLLSKLLQFIETNDNEPNVMDRRSVRETLSAFQRMKVTSIRCKVFKKNKWKLCFRVNDKKEFEGEGPSFGEALFAACESFERFTERAGLN